MKKIAFFYFCSWVIITGIIFILSFLFFDITPIYADKARSTLFSAFLTMGSFTLSLMTMFMFSLKDKLFDNEDYQARVKSISETLGKRINIYDPLINISRVFLFCVGCCFCTSLLQFTLGLTPYLISTSVCAGAALTTIILALFILYKVWANLEVWFDILKKRP